MEVLSELLGILKAIDYDAVINDLEIEKLKSWIESNKSVQNSMYKEIIEKLTKILEDNRITLEEKEDIIKIIDKINNTPNINNFNQLIGILTGIISDNQINLMEIENLKKWLEDNSQLAYLKTYQEINNNVLMTLKDGVLDDDKKQKLLIYFTMLLKNINTNQKIINLKKMIINNEIIGIQLIDLLDNEEIITKIHYEAIQELDKLIKNRCSVYDIDSEIIFISLSLIALLKYSDGNYFDYVNDTYEDLYNKYSRQRIESQIRSVINKYKKVNNEYRIISEVIRNAIVPKKYLPSFFEFIADIYHLNFNYTIAPNCDLDEEFLFVYDGIKKELNKENEELNLKVTNKTYSLIKTTKDLIIDPDKIKYLIQLSINILKIIDIDFWNPNDLKINNEYYKYGYDEWSKKINKSVERKIRSESELKSRWEPTFKIEAYKIYLKIPEHKIKNSYDYKKLRIEITNNDYLIYENDKIDVYEIIGGYRLEINDVEIANPLGKIRYKVFAGNEIIYDSLEKLYRNYIVFDRKGNELENNKDYQGMAIICYNGILENINSISETNDYKLGYLDVKENYYIEINNEIFNFTSIFKPGIVGKLINGKYIKDNIETTIYEEVEGISYETSNKIENIVLNINGKRYHFKELDVEIKERGIYKNYFIHKKLENNFYNIMIEEINDGKYNIIQRFNILVDNNFNFKTTQIEEKSYLVEIECLNKNYEAFVNYDISDINKIKIGEEELYLPLDISIFKVDNYDWKSMDDYIWGKGLSSSSKLRTNGFLYDEVRVTSLNNVELEKLYPTKNNFYNDLLIGSLKSYGEYDIIYLNFYYKNKKIGILKCYCKCLIDNNNTSFWYDMSTNEYKGKIFYFGKGNIILNVFDRNEIIFEKKVESGDFVTINNLKAFKKYKIEIIEKPTGFTLEKERILYSGTLKYYSLEEIVGQYFKIDMIDYDKFINGKLERNTHKLFQTFIEITKKISKYEFKGNLYVYKGKKYYLSNINPVEIEFTSDINDGIIEASITKDGDGLLIDFINNTILNSLESKTAIDIFSCFIMIERSNKNE